MGTRLTETPAPVAARTLLDLGLSRAAVVRTLVVQYRLTNRQAANAIRSAGVDAEVAGR
jgi:hypothetical protein